jgi:hypothetical protein
MDANWGSVPEWIGGVGAALAFGIAVVVFWSESRERRLADRREQAEVITAWTGGITPTYRESIQGRGREYMVTMRVNLINASPSVIYDLVVVLTCEHLETAMPVQVDPGTATSTIMQSEPTAWEARRDRLARGRAKVLPPGRWKVAVRLSNTSVVGKDLNLFFRDHRGVYWRRDPHGRLTEQPGPPNDGDGKGRIRQIEDELGEEPSDAGVGVLAPKPLTDEDAT